MSRPTYGPGMAIPAGRSIPVADRPVQGGMDAFLSRWVPQSMQGGMERAELERDMYAINNRQPPYEGQPGLYGFEGMGGIPRLEFGMGDIPQTSGALGRIDPAIIQALFQGGQQTPDPNILQQVIMQLQRAGQGPGV